MTRINVVPVDWLCDQHLFAEYRESSRIPNKVRAGHLANQTNIPGKYTVQTAQNPKGGKGHEYFFAARLKWLEGRRLAAYTECRVRRIHATWPYPFGRLTPRVPQDLLWTPSEEDRALNITRLIEMFPDGARLFGQPAVICIKDAGPVPRGMCVKLIDAEVYADLNKLSFAEYFLKIGTLKGARQWLNK